MRNIMITLVAAAFASCAAPDRIALESRAYSEPVVIDNQPYIHIHRETRYRYNHRRPDHSRSRAAGLQPKEDK